MPSWPSHLVVAAVLLAMPAQADARSLQLERGRLAGAPEVVRDPEAGGGRAVALSGHGFARRAFATRDGVAVLVLRGRALRCTRI